jgi:hypothetical protein
VTYTLATTVTVIHTPRHATFVPMSHRHRLSHRPEKYTRGKEEEEEEEEETSLEDSVRHPEPRPSSEPLRRAARRA